MTKSKRIPQNENLPPRLAQGAQNYTIIRTLYQSILYMECLKMVKLNQINFKLSNNWQFWFGQKEKWLLN